MGFAVFGVLGLVVMTDNRLGSDGGGAIALGIALAVLGPRLFKLGVRGFVGLLASAAVAVLWIVSQGLAHPGPNHLRSVFADHGAGLVSSLESRVPLSYLPALHAWQMVVPLLFVLAVAFALSWRFAREQSTRDVLLAFGVAIVTSLLVNDSAAYELTAGIAVVGALARFAPAPAPARAAVLVPTIARLLVRARLRPEPGCLCRCRASRPRAESARAARRRRKRLRVGDTGARASSTSAGSFDSGGGRAVGQAPWLRRSPASSPSGTASHAYLELDAPERSALGSSRAVASSASRGPRSVA